jgi:hypothetical protein
MDYIVSAINAILGWIQGFWTAYKDTWVGFSVFISTFLKGVLRFWKVGFGVVAIIVTMTKASVLFAFQLVTGLFLTFGDTLTGVQGLSQGGAFNGAPWANSMGFINAFLPVTEMLAAVVALWGIWLVAIGVRFGIFIVDRFKIWVFNWL